ncbi:hypothetical protein BHE74_00014925 [Ensete ventricosum]|nr:hypothetical protein BHE74_00014925 [Ensete ventricosum]
MGWKNGLRFWDHIITKSMCICGAKHMVADDLIPNVTLRETINSFMVISNRSSSGGSSDSDSDLSSHPLPSLLSLSSLKPFVLSFSDFARSTVRPVPLIPRRCFLHPIDPFPVASDRGVIASASGRAGLRRIPTAPPFSVLVVGIIKKGRIPTASIPMIENLAVHLLVGVSSSCCRFQEGRASVASLQLRPLCPRRRHHQERSDPYGSDTIDREPCGASSGWCFQFSLLASRRAGHDRIPTAPPFSVLIADIIKKGRIPTAPTPLIENLTVHLLVGVSNSRCRLQEGPASTASLQLRPFLSSSPASSRKA